MIVDFQQIHSKPQIIFKQLLHGECNLIQNHKNKKLFKRLGIKPWSTKILFQNKKRENLKGI